MLIFAVAYIAIVLSSGRRVIEAQKSKVAEVTKSAERYRALFEQSLAGMMKFSIESWQIVEGNASMRTMFACATDDELTVCFSHLPASARQFITESIRASGLVSEYEIKTRRSNGKEIWLLFSAKVVENDELVHAVVIDITKRKNYEATVNEQAALLNETQDAIIVTTEGGRISFWNRAAERTYGWSAKEAVGSSLDTLLYAAARQDEYQLILEHALENLEWNGENRHLKRDGKEILVESRWRVVQHGSGGHKSLLIVNTDITTRKRLEAQFVKTQKMESIALLTGGIAHDLQNVLAPVAMSIGLLREELKDETSLSVLKAVEESAQSGLQLVRNIMTYGKGIVGERVVVDISDLMRQVLSIVERGLPGSIVLNEDFFDSDWFVRGDVSQLKQVFMNICVNARDAMPDGGVLGIKIEDGHVNENDIVSYPESHPGRYVVVSIADSGVGISEDDLDRIFEPFFTTKEGGEGTGLGLSIVLGIVKSHDGFITVDSIVNRGTTFRVYLPEMEDADV